MDKELEKIKKKKLEELKQRSDKIETEIEVNNADFKQKVIKKSKETPVVVDFWAEWCAPCLMLGPILEKLAKEYGGKFILAKVDLNKDQIMAKKYDVMSIPNIKLFKNGAIIDEFVGALPEESVKEWLDKNLK